MKAQLSLGYLIVLFILPLLVDCQKGDKNTWINIEPIGSSKNKIGLGENKGEPEGLELQLPPCIRIVERPNYRFNPNETKVYGSSRTFYIPVSFVNTCCNGPVTVDLPPGLMFISRYQEGQSGMLVERVRVPIEPTNCSGGDTTTIYLAVSCLNEEIAPPISRYSNDYNIGDFGYRVGKVTNDSNLLKFIELLNDKPGLRVSALIMNEPPDPGTETPLQKMYSELQLALWKITDGDGLSVYEVSSLKQKLESYK